MKLSLASWSLLFFLLSLANLLFLTLFEPLFLGLPAAMERAFSLLLLVLPPLVGVVLGAMSQTRRQGEVWMAIIGILLNSVFAVFQLFVLSFAG